MIKSKVLVFMAILLLTLAGCEKVEQEQLTVYSLVGRMNSFQFQMALLF
jgi:ABC-type uncharacterized transport system auxiliary subunit